MTKVSVIVPTYNVENYLVECLESIINQTLTDIEIICIDDGSTDGSGKILDQYAQKDNRIKVIHKENGGYGKAMNTGLDNATGEYIGIVEPDDYIALDMYEKQYKIAKEKALDFVKADFKVFVGNNKNRKFTYRKMSINSEYYNRILKPSENVDIYNTNNVIWTGIYNREFLLKNNIRFNTTPGASYQDNGFYFQTYTLAEKMWIMQEPFYNLRRDNPNSSIHSKAKVYCICDEYNFIEDLLKKYSKTNDDIWKIFYRKKFENYMWTFNRVAQNHKVEFLNRFADDFKNIDKKKYLNNDIFGKNNFKILKKIILSPEKYYKKQIADKQNEYKTELEYWYKRVTKKRLNLRNPQTFNEKIQWLKLYDSTPIKTQLADKYLVRDWVKEKIGEEYLIPLLGVYDNFDEIDFDKLPNQFVLKCNHGCGYNIIVKDKKSLDIEQTRAKIDKWMDENYAFKCGFELHYSAIKRKIIIEEYIKPEISDIEIQSWCFNGELKFISYENCKDSNNPCRAILTPDWKLENFMISPQHYSNFLSLPPKPKYLNELKKIISVLCKDFNHVRVDFIVIENKLFFREMTFTSGSGLSKFKPKKITYQIGKNIKLPKLAYNIDTGEYYELKYTWKDYLSNIFSIRKNIKKKYTLITILGLDIKINSKQKDGYSIGEKIFSVKNSVSQNNNCHKIVTILGIKFKFKNKGLTQRKKTEALNEKISSLEKQIEILNNQLKDNKILFQKENSKLHSQFDLFKLHSKYTNTQIYNEIPIVFATNDNYANYCAVTIESIKSHIDTDKNYKIYVLYTNLSATNINNLQNLSSSNCQITCLNISTVTDKFTNMKTTAHFTEEVYYRIAIPEIFSMYEKVLYLDSDLIVQNDIAKLYNENIENYLFGAVHNPTLCSEFFTYRTQVLQVEENEYFNSGVLLINTKKCREENIKEKCLKLMDELQALPCVDQEVLNVVGKGNTKFLDKKWNFQWGVIFNEEITNQKYGDKYQKILENNPYIIHYTTGKKPWNYEHELSNIWISYAQNLPFDIKIKKQNANNSNRNKINI